MSLYILATRVAGSSLHTPETFEHLEREVMNRVREECPQIDWLHSFAVCGPHDYVDVIDAPSLDVAMKASVLVRTYGHADTELWPALSWKEFKGLVHKLPSDEDSAR